MLAEVRRLIVGVLLLETTASEKAESGEALSYVSMD
jgi:hypothetical protein